MSSQPITTYPWIVPNVVAHMRDRVVNGVVPDAPADPDPIIPWTDEVLMMADLDIDPTYQRPVSRAFVRSIVRNFDPNLMEPLMVSVRPDGRRVVMDGQHRREALIMKDGDQARWACRVYRGLSVSQEATLFNLQVRRKKLGAVDQFRAALVANDPTALRIQEIVERQGFVLALSVDPMGTGNSQRRKVGQIAAVSALTDTQRDYGWDTLELVLGVCHRAWDGEAPEGTLMRGLSLFLHRAAGTYRPERLVSTLRKADQVTWLNRSRTYGQATGAKTHQAFARVIRDEYNHRLQSGRIPPGILSGD